MDMLFALLFITLVPVTSKADDPEVKLMLSACDGQEQKLCFKLTVNSLRELGELLSFLFTVNNATFTTLSVATGDEQASILGNTTAGYVIQFASSRGVCLQAQLMLTNSGPFSSNTRCLSPVRGPDISPTATMQPPTKRLPSIPTPTAPPHTTPAINTTSSNAQEHLTLLIVLACIVGVVVIAVVVVGIIIACRVRCVREKCKGSYIVSTLGKRLGIFTTENDTLNEVQAQDQCGCGPTPSETSQEVNGSTTQEKEPDGDMTETSFRHSVGEGSTREAGAEVLNGSMNAPDTKAKDGTGASVDNPKCMKVKVAVEVHHLKAKEPGVIETSFSEPPKETTPSEMEEPTGSESAAHMNADSDETLLLNGCTNAVDGRKETSNEGQAPVSVPPITVAATGVEGAEKLETGNVVSNEQSRVDQLPPPAAEAVDETMKQCEPEGLENYAEEHTKKPNEGGDDKYNARRVPKTATNRSRSNTENSEEQKPTFASGPDASGGSDDCADGHIDPEENSAPEAETGGTTEIVGIQKCVEK